MRILGMTFWRVFLINVLTVKFCYLGQNEQQELNEKVVNHLAITKWLTKTKRICGEFKLSSRA